MGGRGMAPHAPPQFVALQRGGDPIRERDLDYIRGKSHLDFSSLHYSDTV
jgi:hypothetical protein